MFRNKILNVGLKEVGAIFKKYTNSWSIHGLSMTLQEFAL